MKNIHVIPTDKPSRFFKDDLGYYFSFETLQRSNFTNQHIYITSDEQLKFNDYYTIDDKEIYYCNTLNPKRNNNYKKIILTTDPDLIKDGVQAIDDEFLEWFVKNPSCEFIKVELHVGSLRWSDSKNTYKIIIPQEKAKQETLEEAAENSVLNNIDMRATHSMGKFAEFTFIEGAKWQAEQDKNNYSEVFEWLANKDYLSDEVDIIQKEFEQFKKK